MRCFRRGAEGYDFMSVGVVPGAGLLNKLRRVNTTRKKIRKLKREL